jgi:hypothetical protein
LARVAEATGYAVKNAYQNQRREDERLQVKRERSQERKKGGGPSGISTPTTRRRRHCCFS